MKNITVTNIGEYCLECQSISKHFGDHLVWWRGLEDSHWTLCPSLYHQKKAENETAMARDFISAASVRHKSVPSYGDEIGWLFLMQHYGIPTRLLDWTLSPLIALYFAVIEKEKTEKQDAVVWALDAPQLNDCMIMISI